MLYSPYSFSENVVYFPLMANKVYLHIHASIGVPYKILKTASDQNVLQELVQVVEQDYL